MSNYCILNGIYSNELTGLLVSSLPPISKPLMRTQIETIDGRDGDIVTNLGYSAYDKQMEIGLYGNYDIDEIIAFFASEGTVTFSNEPDKYYHYTIVDQIDFERLVRYRKATVTFHVQPYKYDATETEIDFTNTFTEDNVPYIFRANQHDANMMKLKKVVGGTIAWNQQVYNGNFADATGWERITGATVSISNNECVATITGNFDGFRIDTSLSADYKPLIISGHKYLISAQIKASAQRTNCVGLGLSDNYSHYPIRKVFSVGTSYSDYAFIGTQTDGNPNQSVSTFMVYDTQGSNGVTLYVKNIIAFDLTQIFGSTIADYIYSLEQAHAGDGVAWFKALFGEDYYPYNSGELISVKTSARKTYNADHVEIGSYPLDDNLTLRGIPKLDSNNELYYDGDTYTSDGTVTRKYGIIDMGDVNWVKYSVQQGTLFRSDALPNSGTAYDTLNIMCAKYPTTTASERAERTLSCGSNTRVDIIDSSYSDASSFKSAMSGVYLVYELATSTTESADAYTQSQRVGATEEFVDGRTVEIPVGHNSLYYDGTPEITVTNAGNVISKPILTIYGSGDITVSLNSNQIFSIALGDYEYITIDTNAMEAYMGGVLLNRLVTGDYADFSLAVGDNTLSFTGNVSEVLIENYSRWI